MTLGGLAPADGLRILARSSEFLPHFALVSGGPSSVAPLVALGLGPDRTTWFPRVGADEAVEGRFLARVTGHVGITPGFAPASSRPQARLVPAFRGWSTVLLTIGRIAGICPRGDALSGPVDFEHGTVVAWSFPLDNVEAAGAVDSGRGRAVAVRSTDRLVGGLLLASVHRVVDTGLVPVGADEVAALVNAAILRPPGPQGPPTPWL